MVHPSADRIDWKWPALHCTALHPMYFAPSNLYFTALHYTQLITLHGLLSTRYTSDETMDVYIDFHLAM